MSTLRVTNLVNASSASNNIVLDDKGNATVANTLAMGSSFKRNKIINGDMRVDQRNAGASVTASTTGAATYTLDRWNYYASQASKFTIQQNAASVTPPTGFTNYLGATSSSAYTVGASELFLINQPIEGLNAYDLGWGTANAKTITLSFWVRSSLTGSFGGALTNSGDSRCYPFSYSISSANTWEQKTLTITGDTTGTWLTTNGIGIQVRFGLGVGSTLSGTAGSWSASPYYSATGATSVVGTNGATFYITGVQLEQGSVATPYERQIYSEQLAQCQRYYYQTAPSAGNAFPALYSSGTNFTVGSTYSHPVIMRAAPTVTASGTWVTYGTAAATPTVDSASVYGYLLYVNGNLGAIGSIGFKSNSSGYITASIEL